MNHKVQPYALYTDNYEKNGYERPISIWEADPVQCAIDGPDGVNKLFTCSRNATRLPIGFNRAFMAQRCAAKWDGYCDMFGNQEFNADFTGKNFNLFIRDCLAKMFCQNDTSIPGAQCVERCEQYDPMNSNSVSVCMTQGDLVFRSSDKQYNIDGNYAQTHKLSTAEPIRFTKCPKICNILSAETLSDSNVPLNIALQKGIAMDLIENLVENIISQGKQDLVTNQMLRKFMQQYVLDGTVKPNFSTLGAGPLVSSRQVALPAVSNIIPPQDVLVVQDNRTITGPQMISSKQQATTLANLMNAQQSVAAAEPFGYINLGEEDSKNSSWTAVLFIIFIILICVAIVRMTKPKY